jgi:predicted tellurium resistance membrane protein TerC
MMRHLMIGVLIIIVLYVAAVAASPDFFLSIIPGWNTTVFPNTFQYLIWVLFNIMLPLFFYSRVKKSISKILFVSYILAVNLIYITSKLLPEDYIVNGTLNTKKQETYFKMASYLFALALLTYSSFIVIC